MMEMNSPPPCPPTVTIRRNPHRKARPTPSSAIPFREPYCSPSLARDIFSTEILQNPNNTDDINTGSSTRILSENLKVFLRIRPLAVQTNSKSIAEPKNAWPRNTKMNNSRPKTKKNSEICVQVSEDLHSVTVSTPQSLQETRRIKSEVYEGFSRVFAAEVSQTGVYEEMVKPLVEDFLKGKSRMLAAMGPSGSGKTHTLFGNVREPGVVPLALRCIFSENQSSAAHLSRVFYLSMFEISSERGKAEGITDLLHDGGDISMQHSVIKGLQEDVISHAQQAESLIAHGMLRRATAMTNSNSQSSRSQCIINIRYDSTQCGEDVDGNASSTMFTIVDLAGAEREKKTGNQGARLLESNFINNTSMVFGQCLRSLLEHQRNRSKPLHKHYRGSLLTRYLRDYLEGKKRMVLILTVKPGVEDYLDTSFLLRQASPFTKIKFKTAEEPVNLTCNKRPSQALPQAGKLKKIKFSNSEVSLTDEGNFDRGFNLNTRKEVAGEVVKGVFNQNTEDIHDENINKIYSEDIHDENINKIHVLSNEFVGLGIREKSSLNGDYSKPKAKKDREYKIMQGLSKALWTVLKQYKEKLQRVETENCHFKDSLANEKTRSLDLENELTSEKTRFLYLENELKKLKSQCTCRKTFAHVLPVSMHDDASLNFSKYHVAELPEVNSDVSSSSLRELEKTEFEKETDPSAGDSILTFASCSGGDEEHPQQPEELLESSDDTECTRGFKDTSEVDIHSGNQALSTSTNGSQDLICYEGIGIVDMSPRSESTSQSRSGSLDTSLKSEQDAISFTVDAKSSKPESECVSNGPCLSTLECGSAKSIQDCEDVVDAEQEPTRSENGILGMPSRSEATSRSTSESLDTSHKSEQDAVSIVGDVKSLKLEIEYVSKGPCLANLECGSAKSIQDYEDLVYAEQEPTRSENVTTDDGPSMTKERIVSVAAHSHSVLNSSGSPQKDDTSYHMDEKQLNREEGMVTVLPKQGWDDAEDMPKFVPGVASSSSFQHLEKKPKRRLQPASSLLVKDINLLDIKDENDKPKGSRVGKRVGMDEKKRTQGSLSLLNLLTS